MAIEYGKYSTWDSNPWVYDPLTMGGPLTLHVQHCEVHFIFHSTVWRSKCNKLAKISNCQSPLLKMCEIALPSPSRIDAPIPAKLCPAIKTSTYHALHTRNEICYLPHPRFVCLLVYRSYHVCKFLQISCSCCISQRCCTCADTPAAWRWLYSVSGDSGCQTRCHDVQGVLGAEYVIYHCIAIIVVVSSHT